MEDAERKVFQGGIEIMINRLSTLEKDRVIATEAEPLCEMMNNKKEAGRGKIPAIMEPIKARIKLAHLYLVGKNVVRQNNREGDIRAGLPVSDKIFYHSALPRV